MTTTLTIIYCAVAFFINFATIRAWNKSKLLGTAPQDILDSEKLFMFGVFVGSAVWPITLVFALINIWRKQHV